MFQFLKSIIWRDIFKHRWGFTVNIYQVPTVPSDIVKNPLMPVPVIDMKPVKRPLTQSYSDFVREHDGIEVLFITGSKATFMSLGNVGSFQNPANWRKTSNPFDKDNGNWLLCKLLKMATNKATSK